MEVLLLAQPSWLAYYVIILFPALAVRNFAREVHKFNSRKEDALGSLFHYRLGDLKVDVPAPLLPQRCVVQNTVE